MSSGGIAWVSRSGGAGDRPVDLPRSEHEAGCSLGIPPTPPGVMVCTGRFVWLRSWGQMQYAQSFEALVRQRNIDRHHGVPPPGPGVDRHETDAHCILPDVRPFAYWLLRPLLTSRSARVITPPFQVRCEVCPGKNADLPRTTAGFAPDPFGHGSSATTCSLVSVDTASNPVLVHQPAASFHASSRRSVALPPLRSPFLAATFSGGDFPLQHAAHAGRTRGTPEAGPPGFHHLAAGPWTRRLLTCTGS